MTAEPLKAPFPYAGGKSRVADLVWERLGDPDNYVEPFMGSLAVLLRRPAAHFARGYRVETANDASHLLVNFWRAVAADPEQVARWADWPVAEADLHARHRWLMRSKAAAAFRTRMARDPHHYDAKVAGWWCWGACCWIGGAWCEDRRADYAQIPGVNTDGKGYGVNRDGRKKVPNLGQACSSGGIGIHGVAGRPQLADAYDVGRGVNSGATLRMQRPYLTDGSTGTMPGVNGLGAKRPDIGGSGAGGSGDDTAPGKRLGKGVHSNGYAGTCAARREWLLDWMTRLSDRLRLVRTCYGHWARVCDSDSTLARLGTTGVFLDPPYPLRTASGRKSRADGLYATDRGQDLDALRDEVLAWCERWGGNKALRVAVCGYEGDGYERLAERHGWREEAWEASGGYGNQSKGKGKAANAKRERIWFSPHCLGPLQPGLFDAVEGGAA